MVIHGLRMLLTTGDLACKGHPNQFCYISNCVRSGCGVISN
jgi:hypothetical protein